MNVTNLRHRGLKLILVNLNALNLSLVQVPERVRRLLIVVTYLDYSFGSCYVVLAYFANAIEVEIQQGEDC